MDRNSCVINWHEVIKLPGCEYKSTLILDLTYVIILAILESYLLLPPVLEFKKIMIDVTALS